MISHFQYITFSQNLEIAHKTSVYSLNLLRLVAKVLNYYGAVDKNNHICYNETQCTYIYNTATNNYKKIKRSDKANSIGQFISKHWFGILLIVLGTLSFILIILGAIFHIGVATCDEVETTGHLWWKKEEIKSHSLQVLTIIGGILAYITVMTAIIGKSKHNKNESDDSEDYEE